MSGPAHFVAPNPERARCPRPTFRESREMAIVAECPRCGKRFKADEKLAGKKAKCSQCAHVFAIGAGSSQGAHVTASARAAASSGEGPALEPGAARLVEPLEAAPLPSAVPLPQDLPHER